MSQARIICILSICDLIPQMLLLEQHDNKDKERKAVVIGFQVYDSLEVSPRVRQFCIMELCRAHPGVINNRTVSVPLKVNKHGYDYFNYQ